MLFHHTNRKPLEGPIPDCSSVGWLEAWSVFVPYEKNTNTKMQGLVCLNTHSEMLSAEHTFVNVFSLWKQGNTNQNTKDLLQLSCHYHLFFFLPCCFNSACSFLYICNFSILSCVCFNPGFTASTTWSPWPNKATTQLWLTWRAWTMTRWWSNSTRISQP